MPNNTYIEFRSKFAKQIPPDFNTDILVCAFKKFIALDKKSAIDIIWRMCYSPCVKALSKIGLEPASVSEKLYDSLRNELRYQYEIFHHLPDQNTRDFWSEAIPVLTEAVTAFDELTNHSNIIVATVIYQKCYYYLLNNSTDSIKRAMYLLNNTQDNYYYGGLCELGFNNLEADYLKFIHSKVYNLLDAMFNSGKFQHSLGDEITNEAPANPMDEIQEEFIPDEIPVEDPVACIPTFIPITAENVLKNKDAFSSFAIQRNMSGLIRLNQLGFDLNQVVAKEVAIIALLKAAEALSN